MMTTAAIVPPKRKLVISFADAVSATTISDTMGAIIKEVGMERFTSIDGSTYEFDDSEDMRGTAAIISHGVVKGLTTQVGTTGDGKGLYTMRPSAEPG